jgi:uncharacterized protein YggE
MRIAMTLPRHCVLMLALLACLSAEARASDTPPPRQITVTGHGEVQSTPDIARLQVSVVRQAPAAKDALAHNSEAMTAVIAALKQSGIAPEDIQTGDFSVLPLYANRTDGSAPPKITGYEVRNSVDLTVRKIADLGAVLDRVVSLGSNDIGGISFDTAKPAALLDEARRRAMADAAGKAKLLAEGAGATLGAVQAITEQAVVQPGPMLMRAKSMAMDAGAAPPMEAGQQTISADVSAVWELK